MTETKPPPNQTEADTACIERGVSPCCNVIIDDSRVALFGQMFCSLCQRLIDQNEKEKQ